MLALPPLSETSVLNEAPVHRQRANSARTERPSGLSPLTALCLDRHPHVAVPPCIVTQTGDGREALLLAQMCYWLTPRRQDHAEESRPRGAVYIDGQWLIVKPHKAWSRETGLSMEQVKRGLARLQTLNFIEICRHTWKSKQVACCKLVRPIKLKEDRGVIVYAGLVRMTRSANAAIVLASILYWHGNSQKDGRTRLRAQRNGQWCLAKTHHQLASETGLTMNQVRQAIKRLCNLNVICTDVHIFGGVRTVHIFVNQEQFLMAWREADESRLEKLAKQQRQ
jgi:hypothetical protein